MARLLSIERDGEVALVTLERPEKRNALSIELRSSSRAFGRLCDDDDVGCVVLTGAGPAFCSGMDTTQFGGDREHKQRLVETSTLAFEAVGGCSRPVVAASTAPRSPAVRAGAALRHLRSPRAGLRLSRAAARGSRRATRRLAPGLPATVAQELCLTGRIVERGGGVQPGVVREVVEGDVVARGL